MQITEHENAELSSHVDIPKLLDFLEKDLQIPDTPHGADFYEAVLNIFPKRMSDEAKLDVAKLTFSLEHLLTRQMGDSRLIVSVTVAICKTTGISPTKLINRIKKSMPLLDLPSPSWVSKNLNAAKIVAEFPNLEKIRDVEKIIAIKTLPRDKISEIAESGQLRISDKKTVDVINSTRSEVTSAIKILKAPKNTSPSDDQPAVVADGELSSPDFDESDTIEMASVAKAPITSNMSEEKIVELKSAISQAMELLEKIQSDAELNSHASVHLIKEYLQTAAMHIQKADEMIMIDIH